MGKAYPISLLLLLEMSLAVEIIKVGLLIPKDNTLLARDCGMYNSYGAIPLAMDRIVNEQLLNGYNFSFNIYNDECIEAQAAGYATKLLQENKVDVIFGPVCNAAALLVGSLGNFYDKPIMTWGNVNSYDLLDNVKYPTLSTIVGSSRALGLALIQVMRQYKWKQFALLYATNWDQKRCTYIKNDIQSVVDNDSEISISYQRAINNVTLDYIKSVLSKVASKARILVNCYDYDADKRTHMIALTELKMNGDDYVNIFVELRGAGYGTRFVNTAEIDAVTNSMPVWVLNQFYKDDGRNADAKKGARNSFFLDFEYNTNVDSKVANTDILERATGWPFYCENCTKYDNTSIFSTVSVYARYLYDSFYLYSLALNHTLDDISGPVANLSGQAIAKNMNGQFTGATGIVRIGQNGSRDATFQLTGLRANYKSQIFMTIAFTDDNALVMLNYSDPTTTIWEMRNGVVPLDVPICGFEGDTCPVNFWTTYAPYIAAAIVGIVLLLAFVITYAVYYRREQNKKLNLLWQISFIELEACGKNRQNGSQSERSLQSKHSNSTKMTLESMNESKNYCYYYLRQEPIAARKFMTKVTLTDYDHQQLRRMTQIDADNCNRFIGLCINGPQIFAIWKYCSRGSLRDIIAHGSYNMDAFFVMSIMRDISNGLDYIHSRSFLGYHGRLSSKNCVVDERWVVKISDYGCRKLYANSEIKKNDLIWMAPEHLRSVVTDGSSAGDIYSFAIICSEILTKKSPYDYENRAGGIDGLLYLIKKGGGNPIRPDISEVDIPDLNSAIFHLLRDCWQENIDSRPTTQQVRSLLKSMSGKNLNLMDHIFAMVEEYAENLAEEVAERTKELVEEKKKSDILLYRMLPKQVADNLKLGKSVEPENFEAVTIFFSDVVQFTVLASKCTPLQVVNLLNDLYTLFDSYIETHDVYKVETIGDGYMCVSGLPHRNGNEHAKEIAKLSLALIEAIKGFRIAHLPNERVNIRVGAHCGGVTAGVVGLTMPRYCLFGDTVNTASRMESNGKPGCVHISAELNKFLNLLGGFTTEPRGEVIIKGKGVMETFWLTGQTDF